MMSSPKRLGVAARAEGCSTSNTTTTRPRHNEARADEKALGRPVVIWSAWVKNEAEPNTAEDASDAVHRAATVPQATALDPPVVEVTAEKAIQHLYDNLRDQLRTKDYER